MKNLKTTIITALLLLAMVSGAVAQEKWEYATVCLRGVKLVVITSTNVQAFSPKGSDADSEVLKKVEEMNEAGWEVYNTSVVSQSNTNIGSHVYYLRKKKN